MRGHAPALMSLPPAAPVRRPTWTEEDDTDDEFPELLD